MGEEISRSIGMWPGGTFSGSFDSRTRFCRIARPQMLLPHEAGGNTARLSRIAHSANTSAVIEGATKFPPASMYPKIPCLLSSTSSTMSSTAEYTSSPPTVRNALAIRLRTASSRSLRASRDSSSLRRVRRNHERP